MNMLEELAVAATDFVKRAGLGTKADFSAVANVGDPGQMPDWMARLFSDHPIGGLQVGVRVTDKFAGFDREVMMFEIADQSLLQDINVNSYPGMHLFGAGYVAIGCGVEWAGDMLVLSTETSSSPVSPVYQVWHDVSDDPLVLDAAIRDGAPGAPGTRLVSESIIQLFREGITLNELQDEEQS